MIDYELFCKIKHLKEHEGLTAPQIAEELALDPRTVAKWLAHGQFCRRKPAPRPSKLDPFNPDIQRMLENHPTAPPRSCSASASRALTAATPSSKSTCAGSDPQRHVPI